MNPLKSAYRWVTGAKRNDHGPVPPGNLARRRHSVVRNARRLLRLEGFERLDDETRGPNPKLIMDRDAGSYKLHNADKATMAQIKKLGRKQARTHLPQAMFTFYVSAAHYRHEPKERLELMSMSIEALSLALTGGSNPAELEPHIESALKVLELLQGDDGLSQEDKTQVAEKISSVHTWQKVSSDHADEADISSSDESKGMSRWATFHRCVTAYGKADTPEEGIAMLTKANLAIHQRGEIGPEGLTSLKQLYRQSEADLRGGRFGEEAEKAQVQIRWLRNVVKQVSKAMAKGSGRDLIHMEPATTADHLNAAST